MISTLRSIWIWGTSGLLFILWLIPVAIVRLFDRDPARYNTGRILRRLAPLLIAINPLWKLRLTSVRIENPRRPYLAVSNHQSHVDIPFLSTVPWDMKWFAKAELFKIPVLGWLMKLGEDIPVERGDKRKAAQALIRANHYLQNHCPVIIFPEGTRSRDARVHGFSDGAFHLAIRAQVPVLPMAIDGSFDCLPKRSWRFGEPHDINVRVFPPIETAGMTVADLPALRDRVRRMIIEQIAEWRGVTPESVDALTADAYTSN